jgi:hypothetical protein
MPLARRGAAVSKRTVLYSTAIAGILLLNLAVLATSCQKRGMPTDARVYQRTQVAQVEQLSRWIASPRVPLAGDGLGLAIADIVSRSCVVEDDQRTAVLNELQRQALIVTVEHLVRAYVDSDVDLFIQSIKSRDETIVPHFDDALRKILTSEGGLNQEEVNRLSWEQMLGRYWAGAKIAPNWEGVHATESCVWTWHAKDFETAGTTPSLFLKSAQLFGNQTTMPHMFYSERGRADFLERDGYVQVADVWLVISHGSKSAAGTSPYMMRFWFDPARKTWMPLFMVHINTAGGPSPGMVF